MLQGRKIRGVLLFLAIWSVAAVRAQDNPQLGVYAEKTVEYKRHVIGGPYLHTNGFGASLAFGKHPTAFKRRMLQFDIATLKHPKEIKSYNAFEGTKSYVYGKLNSVILVKSSYGYKTVKFDKIRSAGVEVSYTWAVGPTIAMLKPVYLEVLRNDNSNRYVVERYDPQKHNIDRIYGRASGLKGIDEMKFMPGANGKVGIIFEYSGHKDGIRALETGMSVDLFPKRVNILANDLNKNIFVNFYIQMLFGKKYI